MNPPRLLHVLLILLSGCRTPVPVERLPRDQAARLTRVTARLERIIPCPRGVARWEFRVVRAWTPNAHATPSGTVTLTTGLLHFAQTDELLAFALAHEMAHVAADHAGAQRVEDFMRLLGGAAAAWAVHQASGDPGMALASGGLWLVSTDLLFSRPQLRRREHAADAQAVAWCRAAGYPADCGQRFWEAYAAARPAPERPQWLARHPSDAERAAALRP